MLSPAGDNELTAFAEKISSRTFLFGNCESFDLLYIFYYRGFAASGEMSTKRETCGDAIALRNAPCGSVSSSALRANIARFFAAAAAA